MARHVSREFDRDELKEALDAMRRVYQPATGFR